MVRIGVRSIYLIGGNPILIIIRDVMVIE